MLFNERANHNKLIKPKSVNWPGFSSSVVNNNLLEFESVGINFINQRAGKKKKKKRAENPFGGICLVAKSLMTPLVHWGVRKYNSANDLCTMANT